MVIQLASNSERELHVYMGTYFCYITNNSPNAKTIFFSSVPCNTKWALAWYGKLTWESAHAWNLIILSYLIVWDMTFIFMVHLSFYAIPLIIYDVMNNITIIP